jgi:hypothetical protein
MQGIAGEELKRRTTQNCPSRRTDMSKSRDTRKDVKKKPAKTIKEKRKEKQEKKRGV